MKKSLLSICLAVSAALFGVSSIAHAAYTGPDTTYSNYKFVTAKDIKDCSNKDKVHLKGKITKKKDKELYKFVDNSGSVLVEIDDKDLPKKQFNAKTTVEIWGKVEKGLTKKTKVDVKRIIISK